MQQNGAPPPGVEGPVHWAGWRIRPGAFRFRFIAWLLIVQVLLVEWSLITHWYGQARSAHGLLLKASGDELASMLQNVGDVHLKSGVKLLREANARRGKARE